jgi:hypothetical protein
LRGTRSPPVMLPHRCARGCGETTKCRCFCRMGRTPYRCGTQTFPSLLLPLASDRPSGHHVPNWSSHWASDLHSGPACGERLLLNWALECPSEAACAERVLLHWASDCPLGQQIPPVSCAELIMSLRRSQPPVHGRDLVDHLSVQRQSRSCHCCCLSR